MKKNINSLYDEFLDYKKQRNNLFINESEPNLQIIKNKISKKLVDSKIKLALLYLLFSLIGYFISLKFCPHWFIGMDQLLFNVLSFFKTSCNCSVYSIICGAVFTGVPFFLSLLFLNPFKRRFLLLKMSWLVILIPLIPIALPFLLTYYFNFKSNMFMQNDIINPFIWSLSAILTPYVLYLLSYILLRQKRTNLT